MNAKTLYQRIVLIILITVLAIGTPISTGHAQVSAPVTGQTICNLPLGKGGIHYSGEGVPEMLTWGPSALDVAPDGSFWISDIVAKQLIYVSPDCKTIRSIKLPDTVVGATDIQVGADSIWILDQAAIEPAIYQLTMDGERKSYIKIPSDLSTGLSGITLDQDGVPLVEQYNGYDLTRIQNERSIVMLEPVSGFNSHGSLLQLHIGSSADTTHKAWMEISGQVVEISVPNDLGGISYLGEAQRDSFYLVLEEVALVDGVVRVDQTVREYSLQGDLIGAARIPLAEQYTYIAHPLSVGPDGNVYALRTTVKGAEIVQVTFSSDLPALLPEPADIRQKDEPVEQKPDQIQSVAPSTIISTARAYINNSKYLSATNTDGACTGRSKPRYIGGAGTYGSVAYDWNGFDSVSAYNSYMSPGTYKAGDINGSPESCSRGVDCSGFVSRAWGLSSKYGTMTLPNISYQLSSVGMLQRGDILNLANSHVVLFDSFAPNGVNDFESTPYNAYDRVVYMFSSWSRLSGYVPRRYNDASGDSCSGQYMATYYNGRGLGPNPVVTRCENWPINFDWGGGSPASDIGSDNFSARWVGTAYFSSGNYTFIARADDGVRVWLDQNLIIDAWRDQGPTEFRMTRYVSAGYHKIQMDYYENGGGAVAQFRWQAQQTIFNMALNKPTAATSIQGSAYASNYGNDGNNGTRWSSRIASSGDEWWRVDLGSTSNLSTVKIRWEAAYAAQYYIGWSNDGTNFLGYWYNIGSAGYYSHYVGARSGRYVIVWARTRAPGMGNFSFWETEVYSSTLALEQQEKDVIFLEADNEPIPLKLDIEAADIDPIKTH